MVRNLKSYPVLQKKVSGVNVFFREANRKTHAFKFNTQVLSKLSPPIRVKRYRWVSLIELRQFKSAKEEKKQIIQTSILSICY